jgi:hypothetical protein
LVCADPAYDSATSGSEQPVCQATKHRKVNTETSERRTNTTRLAENSFKNKFCLKRKLVKWKLLK